MIYRATGPGEWEGIEPTFYKDEPGTWMQVTRQLLMPALTAGFEVRYFEIAPGGYTSLEHHAHEHSVVILRGAGEVFLDGTWAPLGVRDGVHVPPNAPHQFRNAGTEPFGFLCIVDRVRDRPVLLCEKPDSTTEIVTGN